MGILEEMLMMSGLAPGMYGANAVRAVTTAPTGSSTTRPNRFIPPVVRAATTPPAVAVDDIGIEPDVAREPSTPRDELLRSVLESTTYKPSSPLGGSVRDFVKRDVDYLSMKGKPAPDTSLVDAAGDLVKARERLVRQNDATEALVEKLRGFPRISVEESDPLINRNRRALLGMTSTERDASDSEIAALIKLSKAKQARAGYTSSQKRMVDAADGYVDPREQIAANYVDELKARAASGPTEAMSRIMDEAQKRGVVRDESEAQARANAWAEYTPEAAQKKRSDLLKELAAKPSPQARINSKHGLMLEQQAERMAKLAEIRGRPEMERLTKLAEIQAGADPQAISARAHAADAKAKREPAEIATRVMTGKDATQDDVRSFVGMQIASGSKPQDIAQLLSSVDPIAMPSGNPVIDRLRHLNKLRSIGNTNPLIAKLQTPQSQYPPTAPTLDPALKPHYDAIMNIDAGPQVESNTSKPSMFWPGNWGWDWAGADPAGAVTPGVKRVPKATKSDPSYLGSI